MKVSTALFQVLLTAAAVTTTTHAENIYELHGSGTTNPRKCYWTIMEQLQAQASVPIKLSYRAVGSGTGLEEFVAGFTDPTIQQAFGSGELPVPKNDYDMISTNNGNQTNVIHLPVLIGAVSFFHSVPDTKVLNLTSCIISQIYQNKITSWGDDAITDLNPDLSDEAKNTDIHVVRRVRGSSSTASITQYLNVACDDNDKKFPSSLVDSLPPWPKYSNMEGCEGSGGVTTCIQTTAGSIGYIDAGHGHSANLPEVYLQNKNGKYWTSKDADIVAAVKRDELPTNADEDFSEINFLNKEGDNTWPIVLMTYLYLRKDITWVEEPQEQALLLAFLKALYKDTYIEQCGTDYGFTMLPDEVVDYGLSAIQLIEGTKSDQAEDFFFEEKTEPKTGAGRYVFSVKRKIIGDVLRAQLEEDVMAVEDIALENTADMKEAQKTISDLETQYQDLLNELGNLQQDIKALKDGDNGATSDVIGQSSLQSNVRGDSIFTDKDEQQLKAALVLSSVSFVMWMLWLAAYAARCIGGSRGSTTSMN